MDWFKQLIDFIKVPKRYLFIVALVTASLLFLPKNVLNILKLSDFSNRNNEIIGLIFIVSAIGFLVSISIPFFIWIKKFFNETWQRKKAKDQNTIKKLELKRTLMDLPRPEIYILREFCFQNRDVIKAPVDNPDIISLLRKNIIYRSSSIQSSNMFGTFGLYSINDDIKRYITYEFLDIPEEQDLNEESRKRLSSERPTFVGNLSYIDKLSNRLK